VRVVSHLATTWATITLYCVDSTGREEHARLWAGDSASAQIAAIMERLDTDRFQVIDLELMAGWVAQRTT
jgi:hypothetical protein